MVGGSFLTERELKIGQCERGIVVTRIPSSSLPGASGKKKKPEKNILAVRRETMLVVWYYKGTPARNRFEGCVDIRDIKEIRGGSNKSRDFERCGEEAIQNVKPSRCFVILYGKEFNLKTLSFVALSEAECGVWVEGLRYLREDVLSASYKHEQERWFRKGFYKFESPGKEGSLGFQELKKFLHKVSYKIPTSLLKDKFVKYDSNSTGEISFDDFCNILQELLFNRELFKEVFSSYSSDGKRVTLIEFEQFLKSEHKSLPSGSDVPSMMRRFLQDSSRDVQEPYFTICEFMDWLFSIENRIFVESHSVTQDMSRPLSHYWISSSHNTYLTGDQISSDSSVEAYARCLRMGCRSVELDCWDGPDDTPIIYHGHTLTSKIKFHDVIKTIKDHAFVTSEYPVILSIEDHCTLTQQRKMASLFESVFGDMLVSAPLEKNETALPSPEKLKRRIILKHKKLPEGADEVVITEDSIRRGDGGIDIASSVKNGILYLQEADDEPWEPNFFILTHNKMYYSDVHSKREDEEEEGDQTIDEETSGGGIEFSTSSQPSSSSNSLQQDSTELHFSESWFHSNLRNGRNTAEQLLKSNSSLGEGTFLVRPSETFVGDYSLSFLRQGEVFHVPIKSRQSNGRLRYYLIDQTFFDSLYSLINHYRKNPLRSAKFTITLSRPCPPPNPHESKPWFKKNFSREQAERYLSRMSTEGAFIIRIGERMQGTYAISFRAENKVKHCLIKPEGRLFSIGSLQFESLVKLVNYYLKNPLYKKIRLKFPVNEESSSSLSSLNGDSYNLSSASLEENPQGYFDPSSAFASRIFVRALYDYRARRDDELNLVKNCIVSNVKKSEGGWWVGDYGGRKQHWFPANFVVEIEGPSADEEALNAAGGLPLTAVDSQAPLGSMQKGQWDIMAARVDILEGLNVHGSDGAPLWILRIDCPSPTERREYKVGTLTKEEALQWKAKIQETGQTASHREDENRKNERAMRVARELSNLVIYCRSVVFNLEYYLPQVERNPMEMSSFPETKAEKLMTQNSNMFLWYHQVQLSRVYPKAQRVDSSNYNPLPMWNSGSQMAALNYQTGDKPMQINFGRFLQNGGYGYVLRPEFMFNSGYSPTDPKTLGGVEPLVLGVRVLAARHLTRNKSKNGIVSPNVEVEILGADYDNFKNRTRSISDNGFNPVWDEFFNFTVQNPEMALIRFTVYDYDMFGENNFVGQFTCPLLCISTGYKSVPLKNAYSEPLELSALLVHVTLKNAKGESYELRQLRESARDLQRRSLMSSERGDEAAAESLHMESQRKELAVMKLMGIGR